LRWYCVFIYLYQYPRPTPLRLCLSCQFLLPLLLSGVLVVLLLQLLPLLLSLVVLLLPLFALPVTCRVQTLVGVHLV